MRNVTPGRNAKACHVLLVRSVVWTLGCLGCSARSDNLAETDEISGQIERLFHRHRTRRVAGLESSGKFVAWQLESVQQLVANYS
jgi:hypothetical protein